MISRSSVRKVKKINRIRIVLYKERGYRKELGMLFWKQLYMFFAFRH